jgi:hypothetical protein
MNQLKQNHQYFVTKYSVGLLHQILLKSVPWYVAVICGQIDKYPENDVN